jgi:mono/diheme cytochrome c family protein
MIFHVIPLLVAVVPFAGGGVGAADKPSIAPAFNADIRPIFQAYCTECHGEAAKPKGGLDLRLRRLVLQGGDSGPAIVSGQPGDSLLLERVRKGEMPPGKKKLSAAQVETLRRWVAAGATVETAEPQSLASGFTITDVDRGYWAFRPVKRPSPPAVDLAADDLRSPIDHFVLAKLKAKGLSFAAPADRATLVRRVTFDLTGLPPTPEEVDAFVRDGSTDAFERLVDRLLASPRYGERWGRHWLDVAGYADSEGGLPADPLRADAWKYRDYVIRAFNADKPFDQFIREQLAGDEMVRPPYANLPPGDLDKVVATGFLRMAPDPTGTGGVDQKLARKQVVTDTVKIVSSAFLGLTVGCAECHNHRYDPIPQTDFYRLRAALEPAYDSSAWQLPAIRRVSLYTDADRKQAAAVEAEAAKIDKDRLKKQGEYIEATFEKELAKLPMELRDGARAARDAPETKRTADQKKLMQEHPSLKVSAGSLYLYDSKAAADLKTMADQAAAIRVKKPTEEFVRALTEVPGKVPTTFLFHRGDPDQPKEPVAPGGLSVLDASFALTVPGKPLPGGTTGRRLALANWLTDPKHPLTARVIVNRIWMHHFGKGLVGTPGDFGRLGERPTHPELLDWLASEFVAGGWSGKKLHRLIVTSAVYRQSSARDLAKESADPDNRLLGRFPLRRLDAEAIRDGILAVSGKLNPKAFGPPVPVMDDDAGVIVIGKANRDGAMYKLGDESVPAGEESRRSIYVQVRRSKPLGVLETFDWATVEPNCEARDSSTATPQSLLLLNGEFVIGQAEAFAGRVCTEAGTDPSARVTRAWRLAYGCEPTGKDLSGAVAFLNEATETFRQAAPPTGPKGGSASKASSSKSAATKAPTTKPTAAKPTAAKPTAAKPADSPSPEARALAVFCQALLSSNRFLYVD